MATRTDEAPPFPKEPFKDGAQVFASVRESLLKKYPSKELTEDDLYRAATMGMLEYANPKMQQWNKLLGPQEFEEIKADLEGQIVGIGIVDFSYDPATGHSTVGGTLPGSPAEKAGIQAGDIIIAVDGRVYKGANIHDMVHTIRGKVGTQVSLSVLRGDKLLPITLTRQVVTFGSVEYAVMTEGVGYLRIPGFTSKTTAAVKEALTDLSSKRVRGLVIDLRQNQGGSFDQAVASAELFLPAGSPIVKVHRRDSDESIVSKAASTPLLADVPLAVVVDHDTSSGAELFTAALRDERKAAVIGAKTFGKWSVQTIDELPNGYAAKYTVGLFTSPGGQNYEGVGLAPDVEVSRDNDHLWQLPPATEAQKRLTADPQLRTAVSLLASRVRP